MELLKGFCGFILGDRKKECGTPTLVIFNKSFVDAEHRDINLYVTDQS